jgi:uncharacterized protein (DUF362 family)
MKRREFLKTSIMAGAALTLAPVGGIVEAATGADLVVAQGANPSRITRGAVDGLGGMARFIARGDIVVVKPNIGWDRTPEYAATTNPDVVAAVVAMCYEAGAKRVKIFDHPVNDAQRCYRQSGIAAAAVAAGGVVTFAEPREFRETAIKGQVLKSWPLYTEALEADKIINVPIAKTHGLSTLTLGMKNWMGLMGGWRGRIHQRIEESLVDLARYLSPALVVLDAVRILTASGPQGGNLADVKRMNTVIVGKDQVAVDAYGATLFGLRGADVGSVRAGHAAGLGTMDLTRVRIKRVAL